MQLDLGAFLDSLNFLNRDTLESVRLSQRVFNGVVQLHMGDVCFRSIDYAKISLGNDSSSEAIIRRGESDECKRRQSSDTEELFAWFDHWLRLTSVKDLRFFQDSPAVDIFTILSGSRFQASSVQFYDVDLSQSEACPFEQILNDNFNGLNTLMFHSKSISSPFFSDSTLHTISNKGITKVSVTGVTPADVKFYDLDEDQLLDSLLKCIRYRSEPFLIELSHARVSSGFISKYLKKTKAMRPTGPLMLTLEPVALEDGDLMQYQEHLAKRDNLRATYSLSHAAAVTTSRRACR